MRSSESNAVVHQEEEEIKAHKASHFSRYSLAAAESQSNDSNSCPKQSSEEEISNQATPIHRKIEKVVADACVGEPLVTRHQNTQTEIIP